MDSFLGWIRRRPWLPALVLVLGAALAAVVKYVVKTAAGKGDGNELVQDLATNAVIGVAVGLVAAAITKSQDRMEKSEATRAEHRRRVLARVTAIDLVGSGWNTVPAQRPSTAPDQVEDPLQDLSQQATEWRALATVLDEFTFQRPGDYAGSAGQERWDGLSAAEQDQGRFEVLLKLNDIRWGLSRYRARGGRDRRTLWLRLLVDDFAVLEGSPEAALATAAAEGRRWATELSGWIQHTNTLIFEDLVRSGPGSASDGSDLRWRPPDADTAAALFDPAQHLLVCLDAARRASLSDDPQVNKAILRILAAPLGALRNELRAAAFVLDYFADLIVAARGDASVAGANG